MHRVLSAGIDFTVYFYNPNIHPRTEYILRKDENKRFADQHQIPFIDADYDERQWFSQTRALENEPERGIRCTLCFDYRFEKTAAYAHAHRFDVMSSTLSISRWKNKAQINHSGERAAALFPNLVYWTHDWREQGGAQRMLAVSKQERFYQQEYCGCAYSFRDTNRWRKANGRDEIHRGTRFYGPDVTPEK
jgi:predicted adenine nucleotide alpha hydrolase (AANH) superfamily ATPase